MTPVIPLHRGMGEQDTPTETFSVMCTETGSFVGDLIAVLRTKFHVMDSFKKGHTSLIIESSSFWLSLRLVFKWIRCETSFFSEVIKKPQNLLCWTQHLILSSQLGP